MWQILIDVIYLIVIPYLVSQFICNKYFSWILFQGALKVYPISEELKEAAIEAPPRLLFANLPNNQKTDVLVRVYIVGVSLHDMDSKIFHIIKLYF